MKRLIAVPIHNGRPFLERTIQSLLSQTVRPDEIVCIDDASTDDSASVVARIGDPSLELLRNPTRVGLSANWNRALQLAANFDYVTIAHQDDIYEPDYLRDVTAALESHPSSFIAHTKASVIDETDQKLDLAATRYKDKFWPKNDFVERTVEDELALLIRGDYIFCPSVTFRVSTLPAIGLFDEQYEFVPDWDFWLRGLMAGHTIVGVNRHLIRYRSHSRSATALAEKTLRRYLEEIAIVDHYAEVATEKGLHLTVDHAAAENTLAGGIVRLLMSGDHSGAKRLLEFGNRNIPRFRRRPIGLALNLAVPLGRLGGWSLRFAMDVYMRTARRPR